MAAFSPRKWSKLLAASAQFQKKPSASAPTISHRFLMASTMSQHQHLPLGAAFLGMISVQTGAAVAKTLFPLIGSEGIAALRLGLSALILLLLTRPWRLWRQQPDWFALVAYGLILALMNLLIYRAFAYIPVSIAISIEVLGPLGAALLTSRQKSDLLWIGLSVAGLYLLAAGDIKGEINLTGVAYALAAALFWGLYVIFGGRVSGGGTMSVATGMLIAAALAVPLGAAQAGTMLLTPRILGIGLGVAFLSSMLPFLLDIYAMRHLPARVFGILLSGSPAVSAIAGWLVLHEGLTLTQCAGILGVMGACAGSALFSRRRAVR